ncbi:polysaccharide pyruvyl transferase family protein [Bowmanella sp. Y26]|uniref:polysaccharide pyruvyl transferase family protein n=1 Tax=Bowmanella yangjiangensis TaxID=2811230 RepID=UPI001BDD4088|nr:polysaccharide pyruvyl transferase family protein [Bowmanella yangjiangensis]MBT1065571.1 polysaccharide pyruvyl transferase family protein [Bowmanella yangjiangensis]
MQFYAWRSTTAGEGNFGDDLNDWLWPALMPGNWPLTPNVLLAGVGTVLTRQLPDAERILILGAGAGYGKLPASLSKPHCHCYGVRGPLTAALLGLDTRQVLADPAILIPDVLAVPQLPPLERQVVFVPHLDSARRADWTSVCQLAGITLVDPRQESKAVIRQLAKAKLVLAESMHAAILADAYRVPWIPVWSTCEINMFKWADWALAVGAKVLPERVSPPSRAAWLDDKLARVSLTDLADVPGLDFTQEPDIRAALQAMREQQQKSANPSLRRKRNLYLRIRRRFLLPALSMLGNHPDSRLHRTAEQLHKLADGQGYLSDEQSFHFAKERLYLALAQLKADRRRGFKSVSQSPNSTAQREVQRQPA